jgi:hypothetical protein
MKGPTTGADFYEVANKVMKSVDIPTPKLAGLVTVGAPSVTGRNCGVPSLITKHVQPNTTDRDFIIRQIS